MEKLNFLAIAFISLLLVSSCSEENVPTPEPPGVEDPDGGGSSGVMNLENIYGSWLGKSPEGDEEYLERITINRDMSVTGRWYEGDDEYSSFSGTLFVQGNNAVLKVVFYDENGEFDEEETWDELTLTQLTANTLVIREDGDELDGELFDYYNYCLYKPGGENLLPEVGKVYLFTSVVPAIKSTNLTYVSNNKYNCTYQKGEYGLELEAIFTRLHGGKLNSTGQGVGYFNVTTPSDGFISIGYDWGNPNKYKVNVDLNLSSSPRSQQIEIEYSSYYGSGLEGSIFIVITQDAYSGGGNDNTDDNTDNNTGNTGNTTTVTSGTVNATIDVIGPGLSYDSYAQYIDGKTDRVEWTYNPSTGKYYVYGGIYCSNPDANGGKGVRYEAQKGYNSITIYSDYWLEYRPNSVVPIKYNWEARLKFTIP